MAAFLASFINAGRGLWWLARDERNARVHLACTGVVAVVGILLHVSATDWRWLIVAAALVWTAEAINTAIEELCDRVSPGHDPAIGRVKDVAAGAVLVAAIAAALIGATTLGPPLLERLA